MGRYNISDVDRFWSRVDKSGGPGACWMWLSGMRGPYGQFHCNGKNVSTHRYAYQIIYGSLPEVVRHRCDVPRCVNPAHLEGGTHQDNVRDRVERGRTRVPRGDENGMSKLTDDIVREIRQRYSIGGIRQLDLAIEFGVDQAQVSRIVNHKDWSHIS